MAIFFPAFWDLWTGDEGFGEIYGLNSTTRASKSHFGMQKFFFQVSSGKRPCCIFLQKPSSLPQMSCVGRFGTICTIFKNVKNTHGGVLILVLELTLRHGCFSRFLNCTNGAKSRNASHIPTASLFPVVLILWPKCLFAGLKSLIKQKKKIACLTRSFFPYKHSHKNSTKFNGWLCKPEAFLIVF